MKRNRILSILIILMLCLIWGNSMLPGTVSGQISDTVMDGMNSLAEKLGSQPELFTVMIDQDGDGVKEPTSFLVRKLAHVTEFAVLAVLLWLRLGHKSRMRAPLAIGLGALAGAIDETIQIFSHRGSQVADVLIDACGAVLGVAVVTWLAARRRGRTKQD